MEIDDILLVKYLTNEISEEDAAKVRAWKDVAPENSIQLRQMVAYWNAHVSLDDNIECGYSSLCRKIKKEEKYKSSKSNSNSNCINYCRNCRDTRNQ